ncbi:MAG: helix-turn-helix domain-containing protein [Firmicutes bacterium]|nr:helix-turn-helix domain-containing protein [Bacillota bacterium]
MSTKIVDHFTNPVRSRIFFEIHTNEGMTAKKLLEKFPDIAQPTLYRHLKTMLDEGMIKVAAEKHIRGAVEKSYSINVDLGADIERIVAENDGKGYFQLFMQYIMSIAGEFKTYSESEGIHIAEDLTGFSTAPVYATQEELIEAMMKISEIVLPLTQNEPTPERKLRSICTIITPPKK